MKAEQTTGNGTDAGPADRPMRADARRNRAKVLEVAEAVFAAKGTSAPTEEIAREAGVGIGTVFRHFPTKESLLGAVFVGQLQRLADEADSLSTADDPGAAFFSFFTRVIELAETKNALGDALVEAGVDLRSAASDAGGGMKRALGVLLDRAQRAGAVRDDIGVSELMIVLIGASRAAEGAAGKDRDVKARALAVILDGLRPRPESDGHPSD